MKRKLIGLFVSAVLAASALPMTAIADDYDLPAGGTLRVEGEATGVCDTSAGSVQSFTDANKLWYSSSARYNSGTNYAGHLNFKFNVEQSGIYELKVIWSTNTGNTEHRFYLNGTKVLAHNPNLAQYSRIASAVNVSLNAGENTITSDSVKAVAIDYIKITPLSTLSLSKSLRLEGEDYGTSEGAAMTRFFTPDEAYLFNNNGAGDETKSQFKSTITVEDEGDYTMTLMSGGYNWAKPDITVNIDGSEVFTGNYTGATFGDIPSKLTTYGQGVGLTAPTTIHLTAGTHTVQFNVPVKALVDYIEFAPVPVTPPEPTAEPVKASTVVSEQTDDNTYKVGLKFDDDLNPSDYKSIVFQAIVNNEPVQKGGKVESVLGTVSGPALIAIILNNAPSSDVQVMFTNDVEFE